MEGTRQKSDTSVSVLTRRGKQPADVSSGRTAAEDAATPDEPVTTWPSPAPRKRVRAKDFVGRGVTALRTFGQEHVLLFGLFQLLLLVLSLGLYASTIGSIVYYKSGLSMTWYGHASTQYWLRGRWALAHVLTMLEIIYLLAPQAACLAIAAGHNHPRLAARLAKTAKILCIITVAFAVFKLVTFLIMLAGCSYVPDCTNEANPGKARVLYFVRLVASGFLAALYVGDLIMVSGYGDRQTEVADANAAMAAKKKKKGKGDNSAGSGASLTEQLGQRKADDEMGYATVQLVIQLVAMAFIIAAAGLTVYPTTGLTVSWLGNPGAYGIVRNRYGMQHVVLLLELLYLVGPQCVIFLLVVGTKMRAPHKIFTYLAHAFLIIAIVFAFFKAVFLFVFFGNCYNWPECTTEVAGDTAISAMIIVRAVVNVGMFFVFIFDEIYLKSILEERDNEQRYTTDRIQSAIDAEFVAQMQDRTDESAPEPHEEGSEGSSASMMAK